jgi:hypothetical protein
VKESFMKRVVMCAVLPLVLVAPFATAADLPEAEEIISRVIDAAGGEAFASLGLLELQVAEERTRNDGSRSSASYKLIVDTANLNNLRMELPGDVIVARTAAGGWSTTAGVLDDRPQTSSMAFKTLNQNAFTLLLPFSLKMEGVRGTEVREGVVDDRDVWVIAIPFVKGFFVSPVMTTNWILVVAKDDYSIVSIEFAPAPEYRDVSPLGVRYRILKQRELGGAKIAEQLLAIGINFQYQESGATRVTTIEPSVRVGWDPTLFMSPQQLEALEKDD